MEATVSLEQLQYPIGRFTAPAAADAAVIEDCAARMATLHQRLSAAVDGLTDAQLDTAYRPGGWTVGQVVHHLADSHMNSLIRLKLTLTEDMPTIKPFEEDLWAHLADMAMPIAPALDIIKGLHQKLPLLVRALSPDQWQRRYYHPGYRKEVPLYEFISLYAWHGDHHLAHITSLRERENW